MANDMTNVIKMIMEDDELSQIFDDPVYFSRAMCDMEPRWYQKIILRSPEKKKVLRMGRRTGKTASMIFYMLWYAFTHPDSDQLVVGPYGIQVDEIFRELRKFIKNNPLLNQSIERDTKQPQKVVFGNGARILGLSAGTSSGQGGKSIRGQGASVVYLDECDYLSEDDINSIMGLQLQDMGNISFWSGSTPTGARKIYWKWCTEAGVTYTVKSRHDHTPIRKEEPEGSEWAQFFYPGWLHPNWNEDMEKEMRANFTEQGYIHEVEAKFGEETKGVYRKEDIDTAREDYTYSLMKQRNPMPDRIRMMGVDWDKFSDTPQIVVSEFDEQEQKIRLIDRQTVPQTEYTFDNAVNKIIEMYKFWMPKFIYLDKGYGEYQAEVLKKKIGADIVIPLNFHQNIEVRDPSDGQMDKKVVKHFMVNQTTILMERGQIIISDHDEYFYKQMENYRVVNITSTGKPIFTSENEHAHDAFALTILGFNQKFPKLTKLMQEHRVARITKFIDKTLNAFSDKKIFQDFGRARKHDKEDDLSGEPEYVRHMKSIEFARKKERTNSSWGGRGKQRKPVKRRQL